jgi:methionyl-tRNA synthetase
MYVVAPSTSFGAMPGQPANAKAPHVGHLHTLVLSDVVARYSRLRYPDRAVLFATGTDEHGLKIQQAAKKGGVDEQTFCDRVSERFRVSLRIRPAAARQLVTSRT